MAIHGSKVAAGRALRAAMALAVATTVAVGVVAVVHDLALPRIEANQRAQRLEQLASVLGSTSYDNNPLEDTVQVRDPELLGTTETLTAHRVRKGGQPVAVLLNAVAPDGYSGAIRLLVAIDAEGKVLGARVLEHRETPGLGDFIEARRSDWIHGFNGRSLADPPPARWLVRKDGGDFDQFTGATVTARAMVGSVRNALTYFEQHRNQLFAEPTAAPAP